MSYIDELRERFQAAEERFGRISDAGKDYRERLMGLMSRIEEEIRCRRDVEAQQAKEIERLSGENEELRGMLMSLLQAVESGDQGDLDETLGEMDAKVAALIGEGQGAPMAGLSATDADDREPDADAADDGSVDGQSDLFLSEDESDVVLSEDTLPENAFAGEDDPRAIEEDATDLDAEMTAIEEEYAAADDPEPVADDADADEAEVAASQASETGSAAEIADFFGADGGGSGDEILPAYAHPAGDWEDFLNEDTPSAEGAAASEDPEAGSIRDLMDRVKTEVEGDADDAEDDTNGGAAAAG